MRHPPLAPARVQHPVLGRRRRPWPLPVRAAHRRPVSPDSLAPRAVPPKPAGSFLTSDHRRHPRAARQGRSRPGRGPGRRPGTHPRPKEPALIDPYQNRPCLAALPLVAGQPPVTALGAPIAASVLGVQRPPPAHVDVLQGPGRASPTAGFTAAVPVRPTTVPAHVTTWSPGCDLRAAGRSPTIAGTSQDALAGAGAADQAAASDALLGVHPRPPACCGELRLPGSIWLTAGSTDDLGGQPLQALNGSDAGHTDGREARPIRPGASRPTSHGARPYVPLGRAGGTLDEPGGRG
ncbi:hypothetical protein SVIOM342S_08901 [Streptomyces violaceorubidus]